MEKKIDSVKKFASKHRVAIAVGTTATAATVAHILIVKRFNDFLAEKGLDTEFYAFDE